MRLHERCGRPTKRTGKPCGQGFAMNGGVWGPACRLHLTQDELAALNAESEQLATRVAASAAPADKPACATWAVTDADRAAVAAANEWTTRHVLRHWQGSRCAVCGFMDRLVLDHDHDSALIRGWLCRNCNVQEPHADARFAAYRAQPPAAILGITARYHSPMFGWSKPSPPLPPLDRDPSFLVAAATSAG